MITINEKNIWYILYLMWNIIIIYNYNNYTYLKPSILHGDIIDLTWTGWYAIVTFVSDIAIILSTMLLCFDGKYKFEKQLKIPFLYNLYKSYKKRNLLKNKRLEIENEILNNIENDIKFEHLINQLDIINKKITS